MRSPCHPIEARLGKAFTLIELLVVISIIAVLAGLTTSVAGRATSAGRISRTRGELHQLQTAIDAYQSQLNFFPPDNRMNPAVNPLFYELSGVVTTDGLTFQTKNSSEKISSTALKNYFGVEGILNQAKESRNARSYANFRSSQYAEISVNPDVEVLVAPVKMPLAIQGRTLVQPIPNKPGLNPWKYVSTSPTNNPSRYDLWVDLIIAGKTNRVGNW